MNEQPEALRLADAMQHYWDERGPDAEAVAAELRRLYQFAEEQIGRATTAQAALQMTKATHALKITTLEAALRQAVEALETVVVDAKTTPNAYEATRQAITAARQALGEQT